MFQVKNENFNQIRWCIDNFAVFHSDHSLVYQKMDRHDQNPPRWCWDQKYIYFRELEDITLFKLVWYNA